MPLLLGHLTQKICYLFRDLRLAPVLVDSHMINAKQGKVAWFLSKECIVRFVDLIPDIITVLHFLFPLFYKQNILHQGELET